MKSIAKMIAIGLIGATIFIGACSQEKDYSKNFITPNDAPLGSYDVAKYEKGIFTGIGWSADKEDGVPLKKVLVYIDGKEAGEARFTINRPDVVGVFKNDNWLKCGWQISAQIPLNKGTHTSMALSYDSKDALLVSTKEFKVE
ncbi:MAG TPA: hypothetical protein DCZ97_05035 [Syntrophus sp. (in: bacteria)]|nr:hypothetical protein [Syntrophus sp. (in: bacteria)]